MDSTQKDDSAVKPVVHMFGYQTVMKKTKEDPPTNKISKPDLRLHTFLTQTDAGRNEYLEQLKTINQATEASQKQLLEALDNGYKPVLLSPEERELVQASRRRISSWKERHTLYTTKVQPVAKEQMALLSKLKQELAYELAGSFAAACDRYREAEKQCLEAIGKTFETLSPSEYMAIKDDLQNDGYMTTARTTRQLCDMLFDEMMHDI